MYPKFKIKILNDILNDSRIYLAIKMTYSLKIFYGSAMDGRSKPELLEIFNMNLKKNVFFPGFFS